MRGSVRLAALSRAARDLRLDPRLGRASARTARPTSRSSTTPRCARSRTCGSCGRATPTRPRRLGARGRAARRPGRARADPPEAADARGHGREGARRRPARRLRPARRRRAATPEIDPDRDRLRAAARVRGAPRRSRRTGSPTRVVSLPCWELFEPRTRPTAIRPAADVRARVSRRGRRVARLGALGRRRGRDRRPRPLRRVGAGRDDLRALRLHRRARRGGRARRRSGTACAAASRRSSRATCRRRAAAVARGASGVERPRTRTRAQLDRRLSRHTEHRMRVAFAADHGGADLKDELLRRLGPPASATSWIDLGGDGSDPHDDYPDFAAGRRGDPGRRRRARAS